MSTRPGIRSPLPIGQTAAGGLVIGGVLAAPLLGPVGAVTAVPGIIWAGASARRRHEHHRIEHKSKWRQRAVRALGFEVSRNELEQKLAGTHPDGSGLRAEFQEGEYLPQDQRFVGSRDMEFDARDNEYLGLHALALQVQDLVLGNGTGYNPESPCIQLLEAVGIDAVRLLAICKAASAKPADVQLDYIQSKIASSLGMKLRVEAGGVQALPHVSVFLRHFENARKAAFKRVDRIDEEWGQETLNALAERYPDPETALLAFDSTIGKFLEKTEGLPQADLFAKTAFMLDLKEIAALPKKEAAARAKAKRKFDHLLESQDQKVEALEKARALREAADLVEQLERSGRPGPQPAATTPQLSARG
ncbi:hypothetical protein [Variovorax soli]|uniref:Nucleotide-binding universal stress UspA family protein n=1 Tax=Variovorax soli TaxID=376815 RepID=A0ABU1N8J8_9BURK|nr:hypothetical protein [Variovorax soli]MDR6534375.1 nucleotide-binding universal stress UspA family protein [Variovorax soli]